MSLSAIQRIQKRAFYPVKLVNGETVHIKALTFSQLKTVREFQGEDESIGFAIGCCLLEESGQPSFVKTDDESPKQFGGRVLEAIDLPFDIREPLVEAIFKLSSSPSEKAQEAIVKN